METERYMIRNIASVGLPVGEILRIKKNRIMPDVPGTEEGAKRISIVTGIHGDELEGQLVCYEVNRIIRENPGHLKGIVDIYPAMNPFGIDSITRGIPAYDLDMNRIFPGDKEGDMMEYVASCIVDDLVGSDVAIDIHASNIYLTEVPQIRINELHADTLVPLGEKLNVDLIWVHSNATVLEATLAYSLNTRNTPTLVVEMGVGMRLTKGYCEQLVEGIFHLMKSMGIWDGPAVEMVKKPVVSDDPEDVTFLNAEKSGIWVKGVEHDTILKKGDRIGKIVDPLTGTDICIVEAPNDGWLFTIREYPVVQEGSLIARIMRKCPE